MQGGTSRPGGVDTARMMKLTLATALILALAVAACGDDGAEPIDCSVSTLSYANFGSSFLADNCTTCHSTSSSDRRGAPVAVNFDTLDAVQILSSRIDRRAGEGKSMPPSIAPVFPSNAERALLSEWMQCGAN